MFRGISFIYFLLHNLFITTAQQTFRHITGNITFVSELDIPATSVKVVLTSNQITELHDDDFQHLGQCSSLHLGLNKIHTIEDRAFRGLNNLKKLYLHFNQLTKLPNLTDLPRLKELIIHSNKFRGALPFDVPILQNNVLEILSIGHMDITFVPPQFLLNFPNLLELSICCNDIYETPRVDVISDHLEVLDISSNAISQLDPVFFKKDKPSTLREFRFEPTGAVLSVNVNKDFFRELPNLEVIYIASWGLNKCPDLSDNVRKLKSLTINNNPELEEIDAAMIFGDPPDYSRDIALEVFVLYNNGLRYISGEILSAMHNLKVLNLIGNKLSTFPMEQLQNLAHLQGVFLESNELSTVCDIGHRDKSGLRIELSGNPLVCDTRLCWLFDSGYIYYNKGRIGTYFSEHPCAQPSKMVSAKWSDLGGDDIGCSGSSVPYGCATPQRVHPDPDGPGINSNNDDDDPTGNGSHNDQNDPKPSKSEGDSDFPLVPIAAGAVGGLVIILVITIGIVIYKRRSNGNQEEGSANSFPSSPDNNNFKYPSAIYITPQEKGIMEGKERSKERVYEKTKSSNEDDHNYAEIHIRDSQMMQELGDINEIGIQAAFYSNVAK